MKKANTKKMMRRLLWLTGWAAASVAFVVVLSSSVSKQRMVLCNSVDIKIDHKDGLFFIDEEDVRRSFKNLCGDSLEGTPIKMLELDLLEAKLEQNPFVEQADIYAGINGQLNVKIDQKAPLVRVINRHGVSFYITKKGQKIPVSDKFTSRVPVATGHIPADAKTTEGDSIAPVLANLYKLATYVDADPFWKALVEQIHVDERGDFEIVPMLGSHTILIGKAENLESKFKRLKIFYKEVLKNVDEEKYRTVNVQYDDQIICTKYF